jgi:hypothetical protein
MMTNKELWEKSQVWESSDDGRGKLKILESVEHFAALVAAHEREECARIAELAEPYQTADLIRARGTT